MINKEIDLVVDKICRCCMCENENMHSVFEGNKEAEDSSIPLSEMLMACASIEVVFGDGLPYNICDTCESKLSSAFEFRQQCQKTDSTLRELTHTESKENIAKEEDIVIQPDVHDDVFDDEDDLPLLQRSLKRKRGRPKKKQEDSLACTVCHKVLHTKKGLRVHLRVHTGEKMRCCLFCDAKYTRTNHLIRHMGTHDKPGLVHPCEHCDKTFTAAAELYKHSREHEEQNSSGQVIKQEEHEIKPEIITNLENAMDSSDHRVEMGEANDNTDIFNDDFIYSDDDSEDDEDDFLAALKKERGSKSKAYGEKDKTFYHCPECNKAMTTYLGLKIHMRRHTGADLSFCKLCNKSFTKLSHLNRHMRTHGIIEKEKLKGFNLSTVKGKRVMECDFCDRKFRYRKSFVHHMQIEHGMSDTESDLLNADGYTEETNSELRSTTNNMVETGASGEASEQKQVNSDEEEYKVSLENVDADGLPILENIVMKRVRHRSQVCHVCGAGFARANHLTRHMTLHRSILVHQCDRCEKAFATEAHLKTHVEEEHINKPYVCTVCNKPFSRGEHLIRHLKVHQSNSDKDTNLKCSICELTFTRSDHLARHTKVHLLQDKRHVCVECGKAFNRLDNLKTHQRIHTGVKDNAKLHLCIYCGKEFNNSSNMLRHSRVHTGERPYVCNICGRAFTQSNDLSLHMRRHTGARPYACGVCPARFIQSGQLKTHRRTTGHWMETQPDLKGGHRVEPVTPAHEPMPIRFKSHGKMKKEKEVIETLVTDPQNIQEAIIEEVTVTEASNIPTQPQRILMGIMGNIKIQNEIQPLIIDSSKLVELHTAGVVNLPSVIQTTNGEEIKLKSEVSSFSISQCEENLDKHESGASGTFQDSTVVYSSVGHTSTTFTTTENFNFQNYH
ncbi:hypothetical protein NQ315_015671 [Exocentrus adspersus]|uniref:Uncharacterized protein n=1 Tax=Exocentrus adspersus TaxID=1586481 RepID=A0AAV8W310_9CUCU|nr:hypothetical protein NQ315_015671 [Exocentrus adspersus]